VKYRSLYHRDVSAQAIFIAHRRQVRLLGPPGVQDKLFPAWAFLPFEANRVQDEKQARIALIPSVIDSLLVSTIESPSLVVPFTSN